MDGRQASAVAKGARPAGPGPVPAGNSLSPFAESVFATAAARGIVGGADDGRSFMLAR
jgi:hypothetical protein